VLLLLLPFYVVLKIRRSARAILMSAVARWQCWDWLS